MVDSSCLCIKDFQHQNSQVNMLLSTNAKIYDFDSCVQFVPIEDLHEFFFPLLYLCCLIYIRDFTC